jgi:hypothetical protein
VVPSGIPLEYLIIPVFGISVMFVSEARKNDESVIL